LHWSTQKESPEEEPEEDEDDVDSFAPATFSSFTTFV